MKLTFEIEFPGEYGRKWLNHDTVLKLLTSAEQVPEKFSITVRDVSKDMKELNPVAKRIVATGGHDF